MINWSYNPEDYGRIKPITPGNYRVRIEKAEEQVSKSGRDMIKMTLKVSGHNQLIFHYFVFVPEYPEMTNDRLGRIFDSFGIEPGNLNVFSWQGKVGAAEITNEVDNQGNMQSRIHFFIKREQQGLLPPWQEKPVKQATQPQTNVNADMVDPNDNDCPF